jgi:Domain of unknown function (DUF4440)
MIQYRNIDIQDVSLRIIGDTAIVLNKIKLVAVVGGNEVTNPFTVTEVYVQEGGTRKLATLAFTRLLTPDRLDGCRRECLRTRITASAAEDLLDC